MASREERKENRQRIKEIYEVAKKYNVSFYVQDRTLSEMILQRNLQSLGTTLLSPHLRKSRK